MSLLLIITALGGLTHSSYARQNTRSNTLPVANMLTLPNDGINNSNFSGIRSSSQNTQDKPPVTLILKSQNGTNVTIGNGLSLTIPQPWHISTSTIGADTVAINLFDASGTALGWIDCPPLAIGEEDDASIIASSTRTFSRDGTEYAVSYERWAGYNDDGGIDTTRIWLISQIYPNRWPHVTECLVSLASSSEGGF